MTRWIVVAAAVLGSLTGLALAQPGAGKTEEKPATFPAPILVIQHGAGVRLVEILGRPLDLDVQAAADGAAIGARGVTVIPPGVGIVASGAGPLEFRSETTADHPVDRAFTVLADAFAFLEEHDIPFVCVDMPQGFDSSLPPVAAVTSKELAMIRFHGRDPEAWKIVDGKLYLNYDKDVRAKWEREIPALILKGDENWPTQPFPVKPPPLARMTFKAEDLAKLTPEHEKYCKDLLALEGGAIGGPGGPSGIACSFSFGAAATMKLRHASAGALPPVIPRMGVASSRPSQTTAASPPV